MTLQQNSNIRRIDELGRIVIPKDMRKKLHIRENESLEIYIEGDEIRLKKYSALPDIIDFIKRLVDIGERTTGNKYIITDRDLVIAASDKELENASLDEKLATFVSICNNDKNVQFECILNEKTINAKANILPLVIDGDKAGLLIEYNTAPIDNQNIIKIFKNLIELELNNY